MHALQRLLRAGNGLRTSASYLHRRIAESEAEAKAVLFPDYDDKIQPKRAKPTDTHVDHGM